MYSQPVYEYITPMYLYTIYVYIYIAACTVWKVQQMLRRPDWQIHSPVGWPGPPARESARSPVTVVGQDPILHLQ